MAMENYDVVPSKAYRPGLNIIGIGNDIIEDDMTRTLVRKICRKYGVGYTLCDAHPVLRGGFKYVFYVAVGTDTVTAESEERKRLMDCLYEIDNRTFVYVPTGCVHNPGSGVAEYYREPETMTLHRLNDNTCGQFERDDNGPFDCKQLYLTMECRFRKDSDNLISCISDYRSVVFRDVFRLINDTWAFDADVRVARPDSKELEKAMSLDRIVTACKMSIRFGENPKCEDCSLYVVQMKDGMFRYAVIDRMSNGQFVGSTGYAVGKISGLLAEYIAGKKNQAEAKWETTA